LTGVPPHVLHDWDAKGIFKPMKGGGKGKGKAGYRAYSFEDLVALKVAAELRETGASIEVVKTVAAHVQKLKGLQGSKVSASERFISYRDLPKFVFWVGGRTYDLHHLRDLDGDAIGPDTVILVPIWWTVAGVSFSIYLDRIPSAEKLPWIEKQAKGGTTPVAKYAQRFLAGLDSMDRVAADYPETMLRLGIPMSALLRRLLKKREVSGSARKE